MAKVAGSLWIEADGLHYVDQFGREWYCPGIFQGGLAALSSIWISPDNKWLHYTNQETFAHFVVDAYGDRLAPANASRVGSIWIDNSDNQLHWLAPYDATWNLNVRSHADVAPIATHDDAHTDGGHIDTPATVVPHTDTPSHTEHNDGHNDVPHQDHSDSSHGDFNDGFAHNDFGDHVDYTHPFIQHIDNSAFYKARYHSDYSSPAGTWYIDNIWDYTTFGHEGTMHDDWVNHADVPHNDTHGDSHNDTPHQDRPTQSGHGDFTDVFSHVDVPHTDIPHSDAPHSDSHTDSHGDVAHVDNPIFVGP